MQEYIGETARMVGRNEFKNMDQMKTPQLNGI